MESIESPALEVGDMGERPLQDVGGEMVEDEIQREPESILSLENCAPIECKYYIRD